jgi:multidrug efflux system membrane fusion protein
LVVIALGTTIYLTRWRNPTDGAGAGFKKGGGPPVSVHVATANTGDIDVIIDALGTVTARNTALVRTRVAGPIIKINFAEGHEVKAGDVLAEVDPRPYQAALAQAQGQLAHDAALLAISKSDLERYQALLKQDSIADQQVADQAGLVQQYDGTVKADKANVETARLNLEFSKITAPIAGRVGLRQVDIGNIVQPSDATGIVYITETHPLFVVFAVPTERIAAIDAKWRSGAAIKVDAYDRDGKTLLATGTLNGTDNLVDTTTSTVKLKAIFDNSDGALFPNQFVNARLTLDTLHEQVLVPANGVQRGTPGTFVYKVNADSTVTLQIVKLGVTNRGMTAILEGLASGDRIVTDGTDKLRDGSRINVADDKPPGGAPGKFGHKAGYGAKPEGTGSDTSKEHRKRDPAGNAQ